MVNWFRRRASPATAILAAAALDAATGGTAIAAGALIPRRPDRAR
jgi:hypothetical protein